MKKNFNLIFLFLILGLVGYASYLLFKPFLVAIFLAIIISQLFYHWFEFFNRKLKQPASASLITCLLIFLTLTIPILLGITLVANEANNLYGEIQTTDWNQKLETISQNQWLQKYGINLKSIELQDLIGSDKISQGAKGISNFLLTVIKQTYQSTSHFVFMSFVMFFTLYYLFKDGKFITKKLMNISPLKNNQEKLIFNKFIEISRATLKGTLVIALIQGAILSATFAIAGISSVVIWGLITAILSLIPFLGSALVWLPAGVYLILSGSIWQGIFTLLMGFLVISTIDNILRPKLVEGQTSLHPLLVLLSTLGGIVIFGVTGFIFGPVIIALLVSLLDIYQLEFKNELKKFN